VKQRWQCQQCGVSFLRYRGPHDRQPRFCTTTCSAAAQRKPATAVRPAHRFASAKPKLNSTQRGLGTDHQRRRKALLPAAIGKRCPFCGLPMLIGQKLELDHSIPRALGGRHGDRMAHAVCNRRAGARLGQAIAARNRKARSVQHARQARTSGTGTHRRTA
jgi:5-methylcytosine-specific restriction endonuclease McrA